MKPMLRRVHLYSAFVLLAFVAMYFVTGYVLTHGEWFGRAAETSTNRTVALAFDGLSAKPDERAFALELQRELAIRGKAEPGRRRDDGSWRFTFFHPGHLTEVVVAADLKSASVSEKRFGWQRILIGFHRLHGYGGGWLYDAWAFLYDLASFSMIVFAVSGVWLWYRLVRNRLPGALVLAAGLAFTAATVIYLLVLP